MKKKLLGLNLQELKQLAQELGLPAFTGKQIADWLYNKKVKDIDQMSNLSKAAREKLKENYQIGLDKCVEEQISVDGTKKYLFELENGNFIESVMIPSEDRYTLCVSSQAGCKMNCYFCMTGKNGFKSNLSVSEIVSQYLMVGESDLLTNTVFMGMGEPLDNIKNVLKAIDVLTSDWGFGWSPKRITLSTIGIPSKQTGESPIKEFLDKCK